MKQITIESTNLTELMQEISGLLDDKIKQLKPKTPETELLTRQQTAELLKVSLPTLWDWTRKDILPAYRIGNKVRYKKSEVLQALTKINKNK